MRGTAHPPVHGGPILLDMASRPLPLFSGSRKNNVKYIVPALALACALAACHKEDVPAYPSKSDAVVLMKHDSVAAPAAAIPVPDAAMPPQAPVPQPGKTDAASGSSQASAGHLSKEQESSAMPLAGQANNHSTPAPTAPDQATDLKK